MCASCVFVNRVSELEEELSNQEKEHREEKLKTDERIKMLEKKYVKLNIQCKIRPYFIDGR